MLRYIVSQILYFYEKKQMFIGIVILLKDIFALIYGFRTGFYSYF